MSKILIGSKAIRYWYPDFPREGKDTDYAVKENTKSTREVEYLHNPILFKYTQEEVCPPDLLLTLKASHLCWDIDWDKHMWDTQFLLKKGHKINTELFFELYDFWNTIHTKNKRSDLTMSKEEFFTNAVNYDTIEHDIVHTLLNPVPIYTKVLKDGCEVELDENKFRELSQEDKLNFVREEVMVMAYERYSNLFYKAAYHKMLKKFIINHVPLFALQFTLENYIELLTIKTDYFKIIKDGIQTAKQNIS